MAAEFNEMEYTIRRKILTFFGGKFHIYNNAGELVGFSKMKAFKLKEDLRIFKTEAMAEELIRIKARNIIDISATYDVVDSETNEKIGAFRRKGLKSIIKDEWVILDNEDREIGLIAEESMFFALFRRFITPLLFPQSYTCTLAGEQVAAYRQNFNPFVMKIKVDLTFDPDQKFDRRLAMAAGLLLCGIEGKQN